MIDKKILNRILATKERNTEEEEQEFLSLVEQTVGNCDLETAKVLMKTFSSKPDYGTQEDVISAISSAGNEIFIHALLEELPRLKKEAPDWIECLLVPEINYNFDILKSILKEMPIAIQNLVKEIVNYSEFTKTLPSAKNLFD